MLVREFDYFLPPELIAQQAMEPRDQSRLLVLNRGQRTIADHYFYEIPLFLESGDLLVFNDTRVIPARLFAKREAENGGKIEVFLLKQLRPSEWECLIKPGKRGKPGTKLHFPEGVTAEILGITEEGSRVVKFPADLNFRDWLVKTGETPLPPYIHSKVADPERYQTIYSKHEGSVAAPTAGLHFTGELLDQLAKNGVQFGFLTLHVGLGTFRPVKTELVEDHVMHPEFFTLSNSLVEAIHRTKESGRKVIAVGTTTVRVLESQVSSIELSKPVSGETAIFIYPGFKFKVVDGLITNFHLPKSTLLMLVSAFAGRDFIMESYRYAVQERYRFFSFGDAMLIR